jgi:acyl carrier protein
VLKVEEVGAESNFFELGGHSLLATQVVSQLRVTFGLQLPVGTLFEWSTVRQLAHYIEQEQLAIGNVLSNLESLSEEEVQTMLNSQDNE